MSDTTRYADGQWNFFCDLCGRKEKSSKAEKTWDGFRVCQRHKERRNPQDFLRGPAPTPPLPWTHPKPVDYFPFATALLQENGDQILQENGADLLYSAPPSIASLL